MKEIRLFWTFLLIGLFYICAYGQLSTSFLVDLQPPQVGPGGLFPPPDTVIAETVLVISADIFDGGAGLWLDHLEIWDHWGTEPALGCFILLSVNGTAARDTIWDSFSTSQIFSNTDTVTVCLQAIDHIQNLGCSCPPNILDTCWTFLCCIPNNPPEVYDIRFAQRTDGSGIVDIFYLAYDENDDSLRISLIISRDGGSTWDIIPTSFIPPSDTGWVAPSDSVERHIIWDMERDLPE
ncbi:hypothetical protein JW877_02285, partial [bacterium]|nr:hypothetical protein [bacterium]